MPPTHQPANRHNSHDGHNRNASNLPDAPTRAGQSSRGRLSSRGLGKNAAAQLSQLTRGWIKPSNLPSARTRPIALVTIRLFKRPVTIIAAVMIVATLATGFALARPDLAQKVFRGPLSGVGKRIFATRNTQTKSPLAPFASTTYTWNQTGTASWATAANWTPTRTTPAATDILVFNNAATTTATNIPTQTIGQLSVSGNTTVNLQANAAATVLTIAGDTGTDLSVASGSALNINGANTTTMTVATGATGSINGNMTFATAVQILQAADASGITFNNGAQFTQDTGSTGNVFGSGTSNSIVFASGSTFIQNAGANPFQKTQPASVVVFQTGSLFKFQQNAAPSFSGRTYANLEINFAAFSQSATGSSTLSIDNLTVTAGTLNLNLTGTVNLKGNISVASGQTLTFTPASASTLSINGTAAQTISGTGTLTFGANESVAVSNAAGVTLSRNVTVPALTLTTGIVTTGANTLSVTGTETRTSGYVNGNLQRTFAAAGSLTFDVGTANGYSPVAINATAGTFPANFTVSPTQGGMPAISGANKLARYWTLTNTTVTNANLTFTYLPADITGTIASYQFIKKSGGTLSTLAPAATPTTTTATINGVSSFSDWTLAEPSAVQSGSLQFSAAPYTDSETNADHSFIVNVSRTGGSNGIVGVTYTVADGTATTADSDYTVSPASAALSWADGDTANKSFTITVKGDTKFEVDETVNLTLSSATGGAVIGSPNPTTMTITNDDTAPAFTITASVTHNEGNSGTTAYDFTVTKTGSTALNATVRVDTADVSATAPSDYTAIVNQVLTFLPADTTQTVTVLVNGDTTVEPDETFTVNLSSPTNATIASGQGTGTGTITNDDSFGAIQFSATDYVVGEGGGNALITVKRVGGTVGAVSATFKTSNGTATTAGDYTAVTQSVSWINGDASDQTVNIPINDDAIAEGYETIRLALSNPQGGATLGTPSQATLTITDNDSANTVIVNVLDDADLSACVASPGHCSLREAVKYAPPGSHVLFAVSGTIVTGTEIPFNQNINVDGPGVNAIVVSGNTATNDHRVFRINGPNTVTINRLTVANGQAPNAFAVGGGIYNSGGTLTVTECVIRNNGADSGGGGFVTTGGTTTFNRCTFNNNNGGASGGAPGGAIYVNGATSSVTVNNSTFLNNHAYSGGGVASYGGTTNLNSVTISGNSADFSNAGGVANGATLNINNSIISGNTAIDIGFFAGTINGDYDLIGSGPGFDSGGTHNIGGDPLLGPLQDNGGATPTMALTPGSPAIDQGLSGALTTDQRDRRRLVDQAVANAAGGDGADIGAFELDAAQVGTTFVVNTTDDVDDGSCTVQHCSLREAINAANSNVDANTITFNIPAGFIAGGVFTIQPTTMLPTIFRVVDINGASQTTFGGDTNPNGPEVVLNGALVTPGASGFLVSGSDVTIRSLVINGFTAGGVGIACNNSVNPTINLQVLSNYIGTDPSGTSAVPNTAGVDIHSASLFVIQSNLISGNTGDAVVVCDANNGTISGNRIGTNAAETAGVANTGQGVHLICSTANDNTTTLNTIAFNGGDGYRDQPDYNFGPNNHLRNRVAQNAIYSNTGLGINLIPSAGVDGVTANDFQDPDTGANNLQNFPVITSAKVTGSTRTITGTLNTTPSSTSGYLLQFFSSATCDGTNGEGKVFLGSMTTGNTNANGDVPFSFVPSVLGAGDVVTATATDSLGNTSEFSACFTATTGTAGSISFTSSTFSVPENSGPAQITFQRTGGSDGSVSATFNTIGGGTATAGTDYTTTSGTVTFTDGDTATKTINVPITDDSIYEGNETVNLCLTATSINGPTVSSCSIPATLTITENDPAPTFSITSTVTHNEGNSGTTAYDFTVTKTGSTAVNATVRVDTADGSATAPSDYTAIVNQVLTFMPADTMQTVTVLVNGDTTIEPDETFTANLSNPTAATIASGQGTGTGTITNDDFAADYTVTTTGNAIVVTDVSGNPDTLAVSEPLAGNIKFAAPGRFFSVNGGAVINGDSGNLSLTGINSITVNQGNGNDTLNLGAFTTNLPSLTINGDAGNDTVNFNGSITFIANASLDVNLQNDTATPGADSVTVGPLAQLITSGTGTIDVRVSKNVIVNNAGILQTQNGNLTVEANQQASPTAGGYIGINIAGGTVQATGTGVVTVKGRGGNGGSGQYGIYLNGGNGLIKGGSSAGVLTTDVVATGGGGSNPHGLFVDGGRMTSFGGNVHAVGTAGPGTNANNYGVVPFNGGVITSGGNGNVLVDGFGGTAPAGGNVGVIPHQGAGLITSGGSGTVTVNGTGGAGPSSSGVQIFRNGQITSGGVGAVVVNGTGGAGTPNHGVNLTGVDTIGHIDSGGGPITITGTETVGGTGIVESLAQIASAGNATVTLIADTMDLTSVSAGSGTVNLRQRTNGIGIDLGGADSATQLGLTNTEIGTITAGTLNFGDANTGAITVSANITRGAATVLNLTSGANIDIAGGSLDSAGGNVTLIPGTNVFPSNSGVDVNSGAGTLALTSGKDLKIVINTTTVDSGYTQLNVAGLVNLNGANLALSGSLVPVAGQTFTIVDNDGSSDAISGTFSGLPQGATIPNFLGSGLNATITYTGGDGNDSVLTVVKANTTTTITSQSRTATLTGQNFDVFFSVAVTGPGSGSPAPTGNVQVSDGVTSCTGTVAAGFCTLTLNTVGTYNLTATYQGDTNYNASPASSPSTPHSVSDTAVWNGSAGTGWATDANWTTGLAPNTSHKANIPSAGVTNEPKISTGVHVVGFTLAAGRTLTIGIPASGSLLVDTSSDVAGTVAAGPPGLGPIPESPDAVGDPFVTGSLNVTNAGGISIGVNTTVNGLLTLGGDITMTGTTTLTQPNLGTSAGTFDVVGNVKRTGFTTSNNLSFGNPFNTIAFTIAPTLPSDITVNLVKAAPVDFSSAVQRTYTITTNPSSLGVFTATVRLHYLDSELQANVEANLNLRRFNGIGWTPVPATGASTIDNWVESSAVHAFSRWTISSFTPTASDATITGRITEDDGAPVEGAVVRLSGGQSRMTITDAAGNYHFDNVETTGFYIVTPSRANFSFSPAQRSLNPLGAHTEALFNASQSGSGVNPLDTTEYFVRQQYLDFLNREPDEAGLNFWVNNIQSCGEDANCLAVKRIDTSAAFFLSIEFQQTGYLVYRTYQSAYGDMPGAPVPLRLGEFKPDTAKIGNGVIVNQTGWETVLENNKQAYLREFVQRARFVAAYPAAMTPAEFVDRLFMNAGVTPAEEDRSAAIGEFGSASTAADTGARGRALRRVAENSALARQESNQAFVLMQYFGYLRRDSNAPPDTDFSGYNFWLEKLNSFNGNFREAEMVKAFLVAGEYRGRFPR